MKKHALHHSCMCFHPVLTNTIQMYIYRTERQWKNRKEQLISVCLKKGGNDVLLIFTPVPYISVHPFAFVCSDLLHVPICVWVRLYPAHFLQQLIISTDNPILYSRITSTLSCTNFVSFVPLIFSTDLLHPPITVHSLSLWSPFTPLSLFPKRPLCFTYPHLSQLLFHLQKPCAALESICTHFDNLQITLYFTNVPIKTSYLDVILLLFVI